MADYSKFLLRHQKNKCVGKIYEIVENNLKKEKILKKNQKKTNLINLSIPFWMLKNFINSSVAITIIPKNKRKMGFSNFKALSNFCLFSVLDIFKNFKFLKNSNFLKNNLTTKFTKILETAVPQDFDNFRKNTDIFKNNSCIYEKIMHEIIFFSKKQTLKWKEECLNC